MLILLLNHYFLKKQNNKKNAISFISLSNFKIVFILLEKRIAF